MSNIFDGTLSEMFEWVENTPPITHLSHIFESKFLKDSTSRNFEKHLIKTSLKCLSV